MFVSTTDHVVLTGTLSLKQTLPPRPCPSSIHSFLFYHPSAWPEEGGESELLFPLSGKKERERQAQFLATHATLLSISRRRKQRDARCGCERRAQPSCILFYLCAFYSRERVALGIRYTVWPSPGWRLRWVLLHAALGVVAGPMR